MKIALLSDIHSNSDALAAVLSEAKKKKVERLFITGDFIDYYYNAKAVFTLLAQWQIDAIGGNHEQIMAAYLSNHSRSFINMRFGSGIKIACEDLDKSTLTWLTTLPSVRTLEIDHKTVLLCHGSPWHISEYIYPNDTSKVDKLFLENKDILVYGHTHYPVVHQRNQQIIVNPGSIGQARDGSPEACWAIWDTTTHCVTLNRTPYDTQAVIQQCKDNNPELPYLQDFFTRTRSKI